MSTIALSPVGAISAPFAGGWQGNYVIDQCIASGSAEDGVQAESRPLRVGPPLPIGINLSQTSSLVSCIFSLCKRRRTLIPQATSGRA